MLKNEYKVISGKLHLLLSGQRQTFRTGDTFTAFPFEVPVSFLNSVQDLGPAPIPQKVESPPPVPPVIVEAVDEETVAQSTAEDPPVAEPPRRKAPAPSPARRTRAQ